MTDTAKIGIDVWLTDPRLLSAATDGDVAETAAAEFNAAHPEYHVEISTHDFRTLPEKVARAAARGEAPDIAEYHFDSTRAAMDTLGPDGNPLYISIDRAVAGRTEILGVPVVVDDMVPVVRDYFRHTGELMAMPRSASAPVLFANQSILDRAGVAEPPSTWREVTTACQAIAELPDGPRYGITWPNFPWFFQEAVAHQGGLLADHDNGHSSRARTVDLASGEMMAYIDWWRGLHQDGHFLYTGKTDVFEGCFTAFENQQVAFLLSSSVDVSHLPELGERKGFTVKVSPMPYNDEVPFAGCMMGGNTCWLAAGLSPAKQDGALAFLQYLSSPRLAAELARRHFRVPVTKAAIEVLDADGWYRKHPDQRVATAALGATPGSPAVHGPLLGGDADIMAELTDAMHDVLTGDAEPAARFELATVRAQQILSAYNSYCVGPPRRTPRSRDFAIPGLI